MSKQSKYIRCAKWETCQQQCASGAKSPFPAYNRIYAPLCFVEQPAKSPAPPLQLAQERVRAALASFGQYPVCPECGHTDRPVCCIPVEQPVPEPPALDLDDVRRIVATHHNSAFVAPSVALAMCDEIERLRGSLKVTLWLLETEPGELVAADNRIAELRQERDELRRQWHFAGKLCQQLRRERKQFKIERDELKRAAIALKRQCSAASECTAIECKLAHEHNRNSHANCGTVHYCHYCEDEEVQCAEVAE